MRAAPRSAARSHPKPCARRLYPHSPPTKRAACTHLRPQVAPGVDVGGQADAEVGQLRAGQAAEQREQRDERDERARHA